MLETASAIISCPSSFCIAQNKATTLAKHIPLATPHCATEDFERLILRAQASIFSGSQQKSLDSGLRRSDERMLSAPQFTAVIPAQAGI